MRLESFLFTLIAAVCVLGGVVWFGRGMSSTTEPAAATRPTATANGDEQPLEVAPTGPYPKAVVDQPFFDFGVMEVGSEMKHVFVIRNEGEAPLRLQKKSTTCKCTMAELKDGALPPGESVEVELTWHPQEVTERFVQTATLRTNDPERKTLELEIAGRVEKALQLTPEDRWYLGSISDVEPTVVIGTLTSAILDEFNITGIAASEDWITATAEPLAPPELLALNARCGYQIRAEVVPEMAVGPFRGEITLQTDARAGTNLVVYLEGKRSGPVQIVPMPGSTWHPEAELLDLGTFAAAEGKRGRLALFVSGMEAGQAFQFVETRVEPDYVKVVLEPDSATSLSSRARYFVHFEVPAGLPPASNTGERRVKVLAKTNHPVVQELSFRLVYVSR